MNWQSKITIKISALTCIEYLIYWINLAIMQAKIDQLPLIEFDYDNETFFLVRKKDFVERFGE